MLWSVYNVTRKRWATFTNYSTKKEAKRLLKRIMEWCPDDYTVVGRKFGTIKEGQKRWTQ